VAALEVELRCPLEGCDAEADVGSGAMAPTAVRGTQGERAMRRRGDDLKVIPVPARLTRPHRVVAALQQAPQRLRVTKGCVGRALRILQALAEEAERRGYTAWLYGRTRT
jgi:hypothetical protein